MGGAKIIVVANVNGILSCLYLQTGDRRSWTIPGGSMEPKDQNQEACARRELEEEAGMRGRIEHLGGQSYLYEYEGNPNSYQSPRQVDPHDKSDYTRNFDGSLREDAFEHIDEIWAPLEESPREFIESSGKSFGDSNGRRCDGEWNHFVRPFIDKIKQKVPHLVSEQYTLKA